MLHKHQLVLFSFLTLPVISAAGLLASMPGDGQNAFLFGMSKSRLMVAAVLLILALFFSGLSIFSIKHSNKIQVWLRTNLETQKQGSLLVISSGLLFCLACVVISIPDKYLGAFWAVDNRLQPLVIWVLLTNLQALLGIIAWKIYHQTEFQMVAKERVIATIAALGSLLSIWLLISITGLGLTSSNTFWAKAGVPLLWPQIFLALGIGLGLQLWLNHSKNQFFCSIWFDIGLVTMVWLAAVILWNHQSFVPGVFNTIPRPPTNEIYPINDALIFDVAAQKMLIGQKMAVGVLDKPIFISFLAILHWLAGTSYSSFYLLQIMCFAFIPVCGYLIGKQMHSRPLGSIFAVLLLLKELNAIALTNYIHVSTSKMILSEMLTTLGVLLFTLFILKWLKSRDVANSNLWIAGGTLGLTSLVRLNSISILPAAIFVIGLAVNFKWKRWLMASLMLSAFVVISAVPWMARNMASAGNPFNFIKDKTSGVIVNQRYDPIVGGGPSTSTSSPTSKQSNYLVLGRGIATNYLHNLIGITIMLPPSFELYNLLDLVRLPYWKLEWDGSLLPGGFGVILGVLIITSLGIASAWMRSGAAGMVPLAVILGYDITTALSLTSGGRYLVPIDWGVYLYFSIGLLEAATWFMLLFGWYKQNEFLKAAPAARSVEGKSYTKRIILVGLTFLLLGSSPVLLEAFSRQSYPASVRMADFLKANQSFPEFSSLASRDNLNTLAKDPAVRVFTGKTLYPRYYGENKGDGPTLAQDPLIGSASFDHLSFLLIGNNIEATVLLPASKDINIPASISGTDSWVVGCQRTNYVEAIVVVFRSQNDVIAYWPDPARIGCQ